MNRLTTFLGNTRSKFSATLAALSLALFSGLAAAQVTPGSVAADAIDGAGPQVTEVIAAVVGVLVIIVAWRLIKKAMSG